MNDFSLAAAFLAGLVSFLSPCVLPLVPGYISMLSGIGMEQLRKGEVPSSSLLGSSLSFIAGFSVVFISFGASASAVGVFLKQRSEEHTSELQSRLHLVCRLLLEKKKKTSANLIYAVHCTPSYTSTIYDTDR